MKSMYFIFVSVLFLIGCKKDGQNLTPSSPKSIDATMTPIATEEKAPNYKPKGKLTEMAFEKKVHDFGLIQHPNSVSYNFKFTNTGNHDLIIEKAIGSCGCTIPEYPKEPIKPGESGKIKVSFNSAGKNGEQHKSVTLLANTKNGTEQLQIKAMIKGGRDRKKAAKPNVN